MPPRDPTLASVGPATAPPPGPSPFLGNMPAPVVPFSAPAAAQPMPGLGSYPPTVASPLAQPGMGGFSSPPVFPPPMPTAGYGNPPAPGMMPYSGYAAPAMGGQGFPGGHGMGLGMGGRAMNAGPIAVQAELRQNFVAGAPQFANELRARMQGIATASGQTLLPHLFELHQRVHAVTGAAGAAGFNRVAKLTSALEALLRELFEDPEFISPSTQRTTSHAVELLATMLEQAALMQQIEPPMPPLLLAVDDEIISRRALVAALDLACLRVVSLEDPFLAQRVAMENSFDLIFLDVEMPGKTGFELCAEIRQLPTNQSTPVVFVTGLNGFEARARSTMSGGNDLIAKPFLPIELAVKAITYLTKSQLKPVTRGTWGV